MAFIGRIVATYILYMATCVIYNDIKYLQGSRTRRYRIFQVQVNTRKQGRQ